MLCTLTTGKEDSRHAGSASVQSQSSYWQFFFGKCVKYPHQLLLAANIAQILAACGAFSLAIICILFGIGGIYYGAGFWGGSSFALGGLAGFYSKRQGNLFSLLIMLCINSVNMVISIVIMILACLGLVTDSPLFQYIADKRTLTLVIHSASFAAGLLELVVVFICHIITYKSWRKSRVKIKRELTDESRKDSSRSHIYRQLMPKQHKIPKHVYQQKTSTINSDHADKSMFIVHPNQELFEDLDMSVIYPLPSQN